MAEAKRDRANLNKLSKALEDKRKELKSVYLTPYNSFEAQAKELVAMIKKQSDAIDAQVKAYDQKRRDEKLEKIKTELYAPMIGDLAEAIPYEKLHDSKWLNVTVNMTAISEALAEKIERIRSGFAALNKLDVPPDVLHQIHATAVWNSTKLLKSPQKRGRRPTTMSQSCSWTSGRGSRAPRCWPCGSF